MKKNAENERQRDIKRRIERGQRVSDIENLAYDELIKDIDNQIINKEKEENNIFDELTKEILLEEELERLQLKIDDWMKTVNNHLKKISDETEESLQACL